MKGEEFSQLINEYTRIVKQTEEKANKIGKTLVNLLRLYFPDITHTIGGCDRGIESIFLWAPEYRKRVTSKILRGEGTYPRFELDDLIIEIFPELEDHIRTIGIEVEAETANKVKQILTEFKEGKIYILD